MPSAKTLQRVFDKFDADSSGMLDYKEVRAALKVLLGREVPDENFQAAMARFDADKSGGMDVNEFTQLVVDVEERRKAYVEPEVKPPEGSILGRSRKLPFQDWVHKIYNNKVVVLLVALCIVGNFGINMLEKQIDPDPSKPLYEAFWADADITFNIIFLIELVANMWSYGGPTRKFWASGWNVFDTIIVTVGVLTMAEVLGPPLDKLKLMRAFRVFRLFKRVESLNKIIVALLKSIPGVINAFVVMMVFFFIYAILAVELFRDFSEGGTYETYDATTGLNHTVDGVTARQYVHGIEYYGTFMRALYTLFQVMTGESWSEAVVRPLIFGWSRDFAVVVGIFYVSFILLTQLVLINVVVAVLLDKFASNEPEQDEENETSEVSQRLDQMDSKAHAGNTQTKLDRILSDLTTLATGQASLAAGQASLVQSVTRLNSELAKVQEEQGRLKEVVAQAALARMNL